MQDYDGLPEDEEILRQHRFKSSIRHRRRIRKASIEILRGQGGFASAYRVADGEDSVYVARDHAPEDCMDVSSSTLDEARGSSD